MGMFSTLAHTLVNASQGKVLTVLFVIGIGYIVVDKIEAMVERLIWGERFEHLLDLIILAAFCVFAFYSVHLCTLYQTGDSP